MNKFRSALGSKSKSQPPSSDVSNQFDQRLKLSSNEEHAASENPQMEKFGSVRMSKQEVSSNPFDEDASSTEYPVEKQTLSNFSTMNTAPSSAGSQTNSHSTYQSSIPISTEKGNTIPATVGSGDDNDLIVQRLQAWKHVVKTFSAFLAAFSENSMSQTKNIMKIEQTMRLSAVDSQFFMSPGSGGVMDLFDGIIAENKALASRNAAVAKFFTDELIPNLQALRKEIKTQVKAYSNSVNSAAGPINRYQKQIDEESSKLSKAVDNMYKQIFKVDPWICKQAIEQSILKRIGADNVYFNTINSEVKKMGNFDATLAERFAKIVIAYSTQLAEKLLPSDINSLAFLEATKRMASDLEWNAFLEKYDNAVKHPMGRVEQGSGDDIPYPHKGSKYLEIIKSGQIEREKGLIKSFTRANIVITHCGFIHSFSKNDPEMIGDPDITLMVQKATVELGPNNTFTIKIPAGYPGKGTHNFRCLTKSAVDEWVAAVQSRIENLAFTLP